MQLNRCVSVQSWLCQMSRPHARRGRGLWLLQSEHAYAPSCSSRMGGMMYIWIVNTRRESVGVLRVTGSLLHVVLACRLAVLCDCSSCDCLPVPRFCADSLLQILCVLLVIHIGLSYSTIS